jgi:hypothetical protein
MGHTARTLREVESVSHPYGFYYMALAQEAELAAEKLRQAATAEPPWQGSIERLHHLLSGRLAFLRGDHSLALEELRQAQSTLSVHGRVSPSLYLPLHVPICERLRYPATACALAGPPPTCGSIDKIKVLDFGFCVNGHRFILEPAL